VGRQWQGEKDPQGRKICEREQKGGECEKKRGRQNIERVEKPESGEGEERPEKESVFGDGGEKEAKRRID